MQISNWPTFDQEQISEAIKVLSSGKVNCWTGDKTKRFEKEFETYIGGKNAIAVSNGTLALNAAYNALDIGPGDEVITTPRTFIATSASLALIGGIPVFADIDINSGNIQKSSIEPLITKSTKAISVVHLAGWPAEMNEICKLAKDYNLKVIEDCSQAHGAKINNQHVGSFGDISTWSFCQDKIMTTGGEGGMIMTKDEELYNKMWSLKDHGKTKKAIEQNKNVIGFKWLHENFGSNYRLTELQSAIGLCQLKKLNDWNKTRTNNALFLYNQLLELSSLRIPLPSKELHHAWYKFYVYLKPHSLKSDWSRQRIIAELNNIGMPAGSGSCSEIYLEKCFQDAGYFPMKRLENARKLGDTSLMFLVDPSISEQNLSKYAEEIKKIVIRATR